MKIHICKKNMFLKILEIYLFIPIGAKCDPDKNKRLDNQSTYHSTPYSLHMHVWCEQ
jgi:hypothetical protein